MKEPPNQEFIILMNQGSGSGSKDASRQQIEEKFHVEGITPKIYELPPHSDLLATCRPWIQEAKNNNSVVVAAGGDGTVNAVATLCSQHGVTLGVIPLGTFNYFARQYSIPSDISEAVQVILHGALVTVPVGRIQDRIFLNNASMGLYKKLIEEREKDKAKFGRLRIVALLSAIDTFFRGQNSFLIKIKTDEGEKVLRTMMVFIGSNSTQLDDLALPIASCFKDDKLGVLLLKQMNSWETALFFVRALIGRLDTDPHLEHFCTADLVVETKARSTTVVLDGEILSIQSPLSFSFDKNGLALMTPKTPQA